MLALIARTIAVIGIIGGVADSTVARTASSPSLPTSHSPYMPTHSSPITSYPSGTAHWQGYYLVPADKR